MSACPRWSAAETEYLLELAGDVPGPLLADRYNRWAAQQGHPRRSHQALRLRAERFGYNIHAVGAWLTTGAIAQILEIAPHVPGYWAEQWPEILKPYQPKARPGSWRRGRVYISRVALRAFARCRPEQLGGIREANLLCLLENEQLAEQIAANYPSRPPNRQLRPVRCVETGEVFPTRRAAARAVFVTECNIGGALAGRIKTAGGFHWEAVA